MDHEFLKKVETALLASTAGERIELPLPVIDAPSQEPDQAQTGEAPEFVTIDLDEIVTEAEFLEEWEALHGGLGMWVAKGMNNPCPLEQAAAAPNGQKIGRKLYATLAQNPKVAKFALGKRDGIIGTAVAVGIHGYFCLEIVKKCQAGGRVEKKVEDTDQAKPPTPEDNGDQTAFTHRTHGVPQ